MSTERDKLAKEYVNENRVFYVQETTEEATFKAGWDARDAEFLRMENAWRDRVESLSQIRASTEGENK